MQPQRCADLNRPLDMVPGRSADHQENLTVTYEVLSRLLLGAGVNFINLDAKSSWALAPALSYTRAF